MSWRSRRGRGGWPEGVWTKGCAAMKRSAGSVTPERGSLAVSSNMQNVTVPPELDDALDTMTRPVDQRPPPIRHSADASPPARQNGVAPGFAAAAIFIAILLGLYTILWKCMSSEVRRDKSYGRSRQKVYQLGADSC
ncbi:uncharacterized protein sb:cb288 isoform X2 [Rhincodon typus]|uniref:uncharacterized protein sb:cb288 isoform X2 n=1 Tax=Rhincodon typus TaxID=259920 RepID=UPI00202E952C|nr:uncharacterized protein sb:cb288 isoform X2 [Rhincodon typus]